MSDTTTSAPLRIVLEGYTQGDSENGGASRCVVLNPPPLPGMDEDRDWRVSVSIGSDDWRVFDENPDPPAHAQLLALEGRRLRVTIEVLPDDAPEG